MLHTLTAFKAHVISDPVSTRVCVCAYVRVRSLSLYMAIFDTKITFQSLRL